MRRRFRERYNEAADRLERALMLWLGIALAVLIIAQVMLAGRGLVGWLAPLDQLDRQVTTNLAGDGRGELPETYVTISLIDHRTAWRAWVLVNGKEIAAFRSRQLVVGIKTGDLVEIDGTAYSGAVTFRVVAVSSNLSQPRIGDEVTTRGSIEQLKRITK